MTVLLKGLQLPAAKALGQPYFRTNFGGGVISKQRDVAAVLCFENVQRN